MVSANGGRRKIKEVVKMTFNEIILSYNKRYEFIRDLYFSQNFSDLKGIGWYNKCQELFPTIRLHIAKIRLFREISEDVMNDHWIKTEILADIFKMISMKLPKWSIDNNLFIDQAEKWLQYFSDSSVFREVCSDDYYEYRTKFMSFHGLQKGKEILGYIKSEREYCDKVFMNIMTIFANHLANKSVNTKKATSMDIMEPIYNKLETELRKLLQDSDQSIIQ